MLQMLPVAFGRNSAFVTSDLRKLSGDLVGPGEATLRELRLYVDGASHALWGLLFLPCFRIVVAMHFF